MCDPVVIFEPDGPVISRRCQCGRYLATNACTARLIGGEIGQVTGATCSRCGPVSTPVIGWASDYMEPAA